MKKSLIFWFAAVTCAAWILVGCEQEPETKTVTVTNGAAADIEGLQALLAEPGVNQVTYYGNLTITGGKLVSVPEGKTLTVTGGITLASGTDVLVVAGGLNFTGTIANSGIVIGVAADKVSGGTTGAIVSGLDDPKIGTVSAMKDYTLTSNVSAIPSSLTLYVYGNLTVNAGSVQPTQGKVVAIGTVTLAANNPVALSNATYVDVSAAEITVSGEGRDARTVTLPGTISTRFYLSGEQDKLTVTGGTTGFTAYVRGNGLLELASAVTTVAITGSGNVEFDGALTALEGTITAGTVAFADEVTTAGSLTINADTVSFADAVTTGAVLTINAALTTFEGAVGIATGAATFNGDVVFKDDLTVTGVTAEFGGPAYFAAATKITLANDSSAVKLAGVTGALAVGAPVANVPYIYHTVLIGADEDTGGTLTAGTANGAKLTFATTGITQDAPSTNDHGITITGKVAAIPAKSYTVASESGKVGTLTVDTNAELALDAGVLAEYGPAPADRPAETDWVARLVLTGATGSNGAFLKGAGSVVAGGTTIVGSTNGWQAVGADTTVIIAADAITGTGSNAAFVAGATAGAITVGDNAVAGGLNLTVTNLAVNILAGGSVAIPYPASGGANVFKLANNAAFLKGLKISGTTGTTIGGIDNATVVGSATVGTSGSAAEGNYISGADGSTPATITGAAATNNVTISNTTSVEATT